MASDLWNWTAEGLLSAPPAALFYFLQGLTLLALWLAVFAGSGVDFFRMSECLSNTALKPSWLSAQLFAWLVRPPAYRSAAYSAVPALFLAGYVEIHAPGSALQRGCRVMCAVAVTLFQLGDSARTTSHRDYLMVYICCALACGLPDKLVRALAYGLCVLYILSSGMAKVQIGGARAWGLDPRTMQAILTTFSKKTPKQGGPILPSWNRMLRESRCLSLACGWSTLVFECLLTPVLGFLLPAEYRFWTVGLGMVILHIGIGAVQSGAIGAFFLPNLAVYIYGLGQLDDSLAPFSPYWWVAVAACCVPLVLSRVLNTRTRLLVEDWPLTPWALFPWNWRQWEWLHCNFVEGDTRLVVLGAVHPLVGNGPPAHPKEGLHVVGLRVVPIEHRSDTPLMQRRVRPQGAEGESVVLYDLWSRILGITTFQEGLLAEGPLQEMAGTAQEGSLQDPLVGAPTRRLLDAAARFLSESRRVVEVSSGAALTRCLLVRVDPVGLRVLEVLAEGQCGG